MGVLPRDHTLDDVIVRITKSNNPNVRSVSHVKLKVGPKSFRIATLWELIDSQTGQFHHFSLKLDQVVFSKQGWSWTPEKSIRLEGKDPDEVKTLYTFLEASLKGRFQNEIGEVHVIRRDDYIRIEQVLRALPNLVNSDRLELVKNILAQVDGDESSIKEFAVAFEGGNRQTIRNIAAASRLVQYRGAVKKLKEMVDDPSTTEGEFQKHLGANPWMFGSEYSQLLTRRNWTRDDRLDYMLRRTVDDFLEIVEIKTAFEAPLFILDAARDVYYPSSKLSPVIGQVIRYIEEVERNRDSIRSKDDEDTLKIRARAIVGRDASKPEQDALRNLNGHLHRIEILTFDQLIRIAERVLSIFEDEGEQIAGFDDDIPF